MKINIIHVTGTAGLRVANSINTIFKHFLDFLGLDFANDNFCFGFPHVNVTPAAVEPLPGWVDNMNGPTGVMIGGAKGVIRSMLCNGELKAEIVPVDIAVNGLILIPYQCDLKEKRPNQMPVFNITIPDEKKPTWKWIMDVGRNLGLEYPFEIGLWYPDGNLTENTFYHWFCVIFFMWLPAYFVDFLLLLFRQKRFMVRVQTKIAVGLEVLQFFTTRTWDFKSTNFQEIFKGLTPEDRINFKTTTDDLDDMEYMLNCILGGRQYVMKEPLSTLPRARAQLKVMYFLDRFCKGLFFMGIIYWICKKLGIIDCISSN